MLAGGGFDGGGDGGLDGGCGVGFGCCGVDRGRGVVVGDEMGREISDVEVVRVTTVRVPARRCRAARAGRATSRAGMRTDGRSGAGWITRGVAASFGVAELAAGQTGHDLLRSADAGLYRAKDEGKNRVVA